MDEVTPDQPEDQERSYDDGYVTGYAEGFMEASLPTARQPVVEMVLCTCGVMSGGIRSANPNCAIHKGQVG